MISQKKKEKKTSYCNNAVVSGCLCAKGNWGKLPKEELLAGKRQCDETRSLGDSAGSGQSPSPRGSQKAPRCRRGREEGGLSEKTKNHSITRLAFFVAVSTKFTRPHKHIERLFKLSSTSALFGPESSTSEVSASRLNYTLLRATTSPTRLYLK